MARLGDVIHAAIERASIEGRDDVASIVMEQLRHNEISIASAATVTGTIPLQEAVSRRSLLKRVGAAQRNFREGHRSSSSVASATRSRNSRNAPRVRSRRQYPSGVLALVEELMWWDELHLTGKPDRLDRDSHGDVTITDFKSGRILDEAGELRTHYRMQMLAYGLLARENTIGEHVTLVLVGEDGKESFQFDEACESEIRSQMNSLIDQVPVGVTLKTESLAQFGEACGFCSYRVSCPVYRREAPLAWRERAVPKWLPFDTWGHINRVEALGRGLSLIYLDDDNGRRVSIRGVPSRLLPDLNCDGRYIECFGLNPVAENRDRRPDNFRLADPGRPSACAHGGLIRIADD